MCLAMPSKVVEILEGDMAVIELGGVKKTISLGLVEDVSAGDYVIVHVGYALSKVDEDEALKTLALFEEMTKAQGIAP
ncbi:Hydrogenase expression/formation protein HypC [Candidatus Terasakiella magnetica]|uniref:Hydrogenase maturation factor HypC n=2 Tax=Candidatus Terasakiella magnetica TaxID=1867952 RepID=A0A1C3RJ67_9PROT|nr:HypC/HybG/HupF family hydrogenase formation chaperone [Candidatus Terasakiella magnetica]SCA57302.1 Hydrogenase expression/formation protein HypC [Candidatus Terasakiella magnetica]